MTTDRHEPGCRAAGNGLLINFQWRLLRLNATLETRSLQSPTLQMDIVRSSQQQALTPPKHVEPVTAIVPEGALPVTLIVFGPAGSLLAIVIVAGGVAPKLVGSNRMGAGNEAPGPMATG